MKIVIISDIHDHVVNLQKAMGLFQEADVLLCCGDICSPFVFDMLAEGFKKETHIVFGNNDGDTYRITDHAKAHTHVRLWGELFEGELGGKKFAMNHYPNIARRLAGSGDFDVVCYGHDHAAFSGKEGKAQLLNPGTMMGYNPGTKSFVEATFGAYDTVSNEFLIKPIW